MSSSTITPPAVIPVVANKLNPLPSDPPLYGDRKRVAFVTGAARGIGHSIALRLAQDGLHVAVNDIDAVALADTVKEIEALGVKSTAVVGDISNETAVEQMIEKVVTDLGYLDVLVANAGIATVKPFLDTTAADVDRLFSVNVRGTFLCYKYASQHFIKQGTGGKLIAASSIGGFKQIKLLSAYCATKFAVRGINQGAALELAKYGITANCYAPGVVGTDMWEAIDRKFAEYEGVPVGVTLKGVVEQIPLGRSSVADDACGVVSFFASRASDYVTGQTLLMDGGIIMT